MKDFASHIFFKQYFDVNAGLFPLMLENLPSWQWAPYGRAAGAINY